MEGSAPKEKEIIQSPDRKDADFHGNLRQELKKLGHDVSTKPDHEKPIPLTEELRQIGTDITHIAGSTVDELVTGDGGSTRDRVASRNPLKIAWERLRRKRLIQKEAA